MFLAFHLEFIYFFYYFQGSYTIRPPEHSIFGINTKKPIASTIGFFFPSLFSFSYLSPPAYAAAGDILQRSSSQRALRTRLLATCFLQSAKPRRHANFHSIHRLYAIL